WQDFLCAEPALLLAGPAQAGTRIYGQDVYCRAAVVAADRTADSISGVCAVAAAVCGRGRWVDHGHGVSGAVSPPLQPGGGGIAALYLQDRYGWRAGKVQMAVDCCIVLLALWTVEPLRVAWSIAGAVALNLVLAMNHRP
ncbi:Uncharacterized protein APZ42_002719, partial [Daphnia magna]